MDDFTILRDLKATKIDEVGNFLFFNKVSTVEYNDKLRNSSIGFYLYEESSVINDYILNTDYILSVTPRRSNWKVTDKDFVKAYNNIINR